MMGNLVRRLRGRAKFLFDGAEQKSPELLNNAADRIEQLERQLAERREEEAAWMQAIDQANKNGQQYDELNAELELARAQLADFQASQHYRYIGKDGKPVLARDLERERDELQAEMDTLRTETLVMRNGMMGVATALEVMKVEGVNAFNELQDMRSRLHAMHRRAQKAEAALSAERARADRLALDLDGIWPSAKDPDSLAGHRKARGL